MKLMVSITRTISWSQSESIDKIRVEVPEDKNISEIVKEVSEKRIREYIEEVGIEYPKNAFNIHTLVEHNNLYFTLIDTSGRRLSTF